MPALFKIHNEEKQMAQGTVKWFN
ncbi:MAG: hypothetical protein JWM13_3303, partial [Arthrobacter sp.]|nr:hypothetical protein [Arthrobacter sp.]